MGTPTFMLSCFHGIAWYVTLSLSILQPLVVYIRKFQTPTRKQNAPSLNAKVDHEPHSEKKNQCTQALEN